MRRRRLTSVLCSCSAALLLAAGTAHAQSPAASIVASDNVFKTAAGGVAAVTVDAGASVMFAYPSGASAHNVVFTGLKPASCVSTAGPAAGPGGALPAGPSPAPWSGNCTFSAPGAYAFECGLHGSSMGGTITVPGIAAPPAPPPPPPVAPPPPQPPPPPPAATLPAGFGVRVASPQRGLTLRGSVGVRRSGSHLRVRAYVRRDALPGGRGTSQVLVGSRVRRSVGAARVPFAVPLSDVARRALRRNGRLAIVLRLTVSQPSGVDYSARRAVVLRAP